MVLFSDYYPLIITGDNHYIQDVYVTDVVDWTIFRLCVWMGGGGGGLWVSYVYVCVFAILISLRKKGLGRGRVRLLITNTLIRETKQTRYFNTESTCTHICYRPMVLLS